MKGMLVPINDVTSCLKQMGSCSFATVFGHGYLLVDSYNRAARIDAAVVDSRHAWRGGRQFREARTALVGKRRNDVCVRKYTFTTVALF